MNKLPRTLLRCGVMAALSVGLVATIRAAANSRAGARPNANASEPLSGDERASEGKAKGESRKNSPYDKATIERYDTNRNGKLDPDEVAAMHADKHRGGEKKTGKRRTR